MRAYILSLAPTVGAIVALASIRARRRSSEPVLIPVPVRPERQGRR